MGIVIDILGIVTLFILIGLAAGFYGGMFLRWVQNRQDRIDAKATRIKEHNRLIVHDPSRYRN